MSDSDNPRRCAEPGCTFDTDGSCLEGFAAGKGCPYKMQGAEDGISESATEASADADAWISLPDGYELSPQSTAYITRASEARVIVVAGEAEAGKTTLITCMFEQFSEGDYAGHKFAWSDTILGFERICYRSRITSEAENADTERTKRLTPRFFHLQLQNQTGNFVDLLITDMSGEVYRRVLDNQENAVNLGFITRANFFVLLLDGERLASRELRQDAFRRGLLLLGALLHARVLSPECPVRVLIAKYDLLVPEGVDKNTTEFIEYVEAEYAKFGKEHFADFQISRISSRPRKNSSLQYGFGVEALIRQWAAIERPDVAADFLANVKSLPSERESVSYLWRQLGHGKL